MKKKAAKKSVAKIEAEATPLEKAYEAVALAVISEVHAVHVAELIARNTNLSHEGVFSVCPVEAQTRETF